MNRILLTGCHGLIGQKFIEISGGDFAELHGVDLQKNNLFVGLQGYTYHQMDITQRDEIVKLVRKVKPNIIVNSAAMTTLDACEVNRERCWQVNVMGVQHLVDAARRVGARFVQLSSDHVFDGEAGPYTELDRPNPVSYYGKSKHASENIVLGGSVNGVVIRTVMVMGHGRELKPRFIAWLVKKLREGAEVRVATDQISNITLVDELAKALKRIITLRKTGIYHIAGPEIISRFGFARRIAEAYNLDLDKILPTLTRLMGKTAPRPLQHGLVIDKTQKELNLPFSHVDEILRKYREQEAKLN